MCGNGPDSRSATGACSLSELGELITHLAFYAGWPAAMTAGRIAWEVFQETAP